MLWLVAADLVTVIHAAYVAFVVIGFVAILVGWAAGWHWIRNFYFRLVHVAMILFVCCEALIGTTCPLTVWENILRAKGGESGYSRDFVGYWLDSLIFYQAQPWVFTTVYLTFGALVLVTLWFVPMQRPTANRSAASNFTRRNSVS
ncbi:MAG TPA: DUF2784 domain-containing protein [Candidatus Binatus sp.]|uniref:DUF2784 domain-containing protein n=1 Tax=Candidatus Binatus sp. TaxID=2811406 RepID=UPI002F40A5B9